MICYDVLCMLGFLLLFMYVSILYMYYARPVCAYNWSSCGSFGTVRFYLAIFCQRRSGNCGIAEKKQKYRYIDCFRRGEKKKNNNNSTARGRRTETYLKL